jgi:multiple sugar transport system permease protein
MMVKGARYGRSLARLAAYAGLAAIVLIWISPYLWMILTSVRDPSEPFSAGILPTRVTLTNYSTTLRKASLLTAFRNSFVVAFSSALLALTLATSAGYGFSRFRFRGHGAMLVFLLIVKSLPGVLLAIAIFVVAGKVHLFDSFVPLVLLNTLLNLPFAIWNVRTVFDGVTPELDEAAMIDGCSRWEAILRVLLPICTPGMAATFAFLFLLAWNEYLFAVTFISSPEKVLVQPVIASYVGQFAADYTGLITASVLASFPLLVIFIAIQRYIISGLSMGALKG